MTSLFQVIAHDDSDERLTRRKAVVLAKSRLEDVTPWIKQGGTAWRERYQYALSDIQTIVKQACDEVGCTDPESIIAAYEGTLSVTDVQDRNAHEASVKEARRPKMCPFHKDVVEVSLAAQDPRAGFEALRDHWGGARHCEGDGYEGEKCKFKPQMTTQSYWDEKAEKAQERKELREQQALEAPVLEETEAPVEEEAPTEPVSDPIDAPVVEEDQSDFTNGEDVPSEPQVQPELMSMAAKTADAGPVPKMDKRKWTPRTVGMPEGVDDPNGRHPTKHQDILDTERPKNADKLTQIGEQVTEHQDVEEDTNPTEAGRAEQGGTFSSTNPLTELRDDPFLSRRQVEAAIQSYRK
jgi:hypothetical protein